MVVATSVFLKVVEPIYPTYSIQSLYVAIIKETREEDGCLMSSLLNLLTRNGASCLTPILGDLGKRMLVSRHSDVKYAVSED